MKYKSILIATIFLLCSCSRPDYADQASQTEFPQPDVDTFVIPTEANIIPEQMSFEKENVQISEDDFVPYQNYTKENPITDPETLIQIFNKLEPRYFAIFDKTGWYRFDLGLISRDDPNSSKSFWLHFANLDEMRFDSSLYIYDYPNLYPEGKLMLNSAFINGMAGSTSYDFESWNYHFNKPFDYNPDFQMPEPILANYNAYIPDDTPCSPPLGHCWLYREIDNIQNPVFEDREVKDVSSFTGWFETKNGIDSFALKTTTDSVGVLRADSDTNKLATRRTSIHYYDLENGGFFFTEFLSDYTDGTSRAYTWDEASNKVEWFERLPDRVQEVYDEALPKLEELYGRN
ncbi:MAG: hypothetical protein ACOX7C_08200 [Brevefilum sp.]|jgi:hypothetical protein